WSSGSPKPDRRAVRGVLGGAESPECPYAARRMTGFGVYVHIPFCARRCDYCDFATWTDRHHLMAAYAAACTAELLVGILDAIRRTGDAEVTVECNPDTVTPELLAAYRAGGVNRLSFGVQ